MTRMLDIANAIRTELNTIPDWSVGGFIYKPPRLPNQKVPFYWLVNKGYNNVIADTHYKQRDLLWQVRVAYDEVRRQRSVEASWDLADAVWNKIAQLPLTLGDLIEFIPPSSINSDGEDIENIGAEPYLIYPVDFSTRVRDKIRT